VAQAQALCEVMPDSSQYDAVPVDDPPAVREPDPPQIDLF
jgi:hypothetical protein